MLQELLNEIKSCKICENYLPLGCNPVLTANRKARILIVGQAPGIKVHQSNIPWNDQSGKELRRWLDVSDDQFYNEEIFAIIPMGFCYPGTGSSGDLPPRKECAQTWHERLLKELPNIESTLHIGLYAQKYYLTNRKKGNLTQNVRDYELFTPNTLPLPHPSP